MILTGKHTQKKIAVNKAPSASENAIIQIFTGNIFISMFHYMHVFRVAQTKIAFPRVLRINASEKPYLRGFN